MNENPAEPRSGAHSAAIPYPAIHPDFLRKHAYSPTTGPHRQAPLPNRMTQRTLATEPARVSNATSPRVYPQGIASKRTPRIARVD